MTVRISELILVISAVISSMEHQLRFISSYCANGTGYIKKERKKKHHREYLVQTEKDIQRTRMLCNSPFSSLLFSKKQVSIGNIPAQSVPDDFFLSSFSFSNQGSDCWAIWVILQLLPRPCGNYFMRESLSSCNAALARVSAWCHDPAGAIVLDVDVSRFIRSQMWSCFENMALLL